MANRNFHNMRYSLTADVVSLFGSFDIGAAGAVANAVGNGVTPSLTATGRYKITLEDKYNRFLGYDAKIVCDIDGTAATALTGKLDVQTITLPAKASATAGDHIVFTDTSGTKWAFALDVSGTDPEPSGATWTAVAAAKRANINISGATTAAQVATAVKAGFDAIVGATAKWTTVDVGDGTITFTTVTRAPVAAVAVPKNTDDSTAGSITTVHTTTGVATTVNTTDDTIYIANHGWTTGKSIALTISSGSLPTGLSATTYYVIAATANTVQLATSLANAEAGTAVNITSLGDADKTMTLTPSISGSGIFKIEMTTTDVQNVVQSDTREIEIATYNASGVLTQPANGSKVFYRIDLRNSSVKMQGE